MLVPWHISATDLATSEKRGKQIDHAQTNSKMQHKLKRQQQMGMRAKPSEI
jgi:hypothetical protein